MNGGTRAEEGAEERPRAEARGEAMVGGGAGVRGMTVWEAMNLMNRLIQPALRSAGAGLAGMTGFREGTGVTTTPLPGPRVSVRFRAAPGETVVAQPTVSRIACKVTGNADAGRVGGQWGRYAVLDVEAGSDTNLAEILSHCCGRTDLKDSLLLTSAHAPQLASDPGSPGATRVPAGTRLRVYCYQGDAREPRVVVKSPCSCLERLLYTYLRAMSAPRGTMVPNSPEEAARRLGHVTEIAALASLKEARAAQGFDTTNVDIPLRKAVIRAQRARVDLECKNEGHESNWGDGPEFSMSQIGDLERRMARALRDAEWSVKNALDKPQHAFEAALSATARRRMNQARVAPEGTPEKKAFEREAAALETLRQVVAHANDVSEIDPGASEKILEAVLEDRSFRNFDYELPYGEALQNFGWGGPEPLATDLGRKMSGPIRRWSDDAVFTQEPHAEVWRRYDLLKVQRNYAAGEALDKIYKGTGISRAVKEGIEALKPSAVLPEAILRTPAGRELAAKYAGAWAAGSLVAGMATGGIDLLTDPGGAMRSLAEHIARRTAQAQAAGGGIFETAGILLSDMTGITQIGEAIRGIDLETGRSLSGLERFERLAQGSLIRDAWPGKNQATHRTSPLRGVNTRRVLDAPDTRGRTLRRSVRTDDDVYAASSSGRSTQGCPAASSSRCAAPMRPSAGQHTHALLLK